MAAGWTAALSRAGEGAWSQGADALDAITGRLNDGLISMAGLWHWAMTPKADLAQNVGDYLFFQIILKYLRSKVNKMGDEIMGRAMEWVGMLAVVLLTIWIMIQGYRMVTGQMRESVAALVTTMAKNVVIVSVAVSMGIFGSPLKTFLVDNMKSAINHIVTGEEDSTPEKQIDKSLAWMQVAMSSMDALDVASDPTIDSQRNRAVTMVGIGTGGPAITAGAMLLLYEIAMALFIGFGPIFILCLLFDQTKSLFQRWLLYGIGTLFSMAVLAAMVAIALDMVTRVSAAMWVSAGLGQLLLGEDVVGGMSSRALQQGGMGLILTTLILTAPPMAAAFFQGTLGQFAAYATMGAHLQTGQPRGAGGPSGGGGPSGYQPSYQPPAPTPAGGERGSQQTPGFTNNPGAATSGANYSAGRDETKQGSPMRGGASTGGGDGAMSTGDATGILGSKPQTYGPVADASSGGAGGAGSRGNSPSSQPTSPIKPSGNNA